MNCANKAPFKILSLCAKIFVEDATVTAAAVGQSFSNLAASDSLNYAKELV